ncbi:MAG: hypothetical protein JWN43_4582, partial [Gammaproteobacteria bacterium]|nr:hypothetical protein [Gammaproteobacteria bacterium]
MAVDYSGDDVQSIEQALQAARPGGWWRLDAATLGRFSGIDPRAGWSLAVPNGRFASPGVDRLYVLIDAAFPYSEPRVVAPALKLGDWPHIEADGVLCLTPTRWDASPGDRAVGMLDYAAEVLNMGDARRKEEFAREFVAYWGQLASAGPDVPFFVTLMAPQATSRELFFARSRMNRIVLSDDPATLTRWLENSGEPQVPETFRR